MPRRPAMACPIPGCPERSPCPTHGRKPWEGSTRRARLPKDWNRRRARILRRDPICRACKAAPSQEVDHIHADDDHRDEALQGLCQPCHATKTKAEAAAGRRRR